MAVEEEEELDKNAKELLAWNSAEARKLYSGLASDDTNSAVEDDEAKLLRMRVRYNYLYKGVGTAQQLAKYNGGLPKDVRDGRENNTKTMEEKLLAKRPCALLSEGQAQGANTNGESMNQIDGRALPKIDDTSKSSKQIMKRPRRGATSAEEQLSKQIIDNVRKGLKADRALTTALQLARERPVWHPPWKNYRVIAGHQGWVRCVAVDASNEWFATGAADRTIKIWDLASGQLKLTLTGHIGAVRSISISERHPYMFSAGDDKKVKCWDLEQNKVIRHYHGHLSGVYCTSIHPSLDILFTGGRDSTVRVWDMRSKSQIFVLSSHRDVVNTVQSQSSIPQVLSGSGDSTIKLWDLTTGKTLHTLTHHKKGVRSLSLHPRLNSFVSASADNIKTWKLPQAKFMRNFKREADSIVNSVAVNEDGVCVSGGDDGRIGFWDYKAAHCFQMERIKIQPGSLESEAGIFGMTFDKSGSRLITCNADKTIQMWKEDEEATEDTHPLNWKPDLNPRFY